MEATNEMLRNIPNVVEDEEAILNPPMLASGVQPPKRLFTFSSLMRMEQAVTKSKEEITLPGLSLTIIHTSCQ